MISKADKGNSIIIYQHEYNEKVMNFISNNSFVTGNKDVTKNFEVFLEITLTNIS
jgi:hypothetical protein